MQPMLLCPRRTRFAPIFSKIRTARRRLAHFPWKGKVKPACSTERVDIQAATLSVNIRTFAE